MHSKSSIFNKGYFVYNLKRTWPLLFLAGIPLLWNVMFRGLLSVSFEPDYGKTFSGLSLWRMENLAGNVAFLLLLLPPILAFSLFSSLYKRNSSDFIGSAPIRRSSIFYTNALLGCLYLIFVVVVYTLVSCVFLPGGQTMVFEEVCRYFFLTLSGALFVFSLCCLATVLSGTRRASVVLSFVLVLVLPLVLYLLQTLYGLFSNADTSQTGYVYALSVWMPFSIPSSLLVGQLLAGFRGVLFQTLYNLALTVVFFALGAYALRKRPFEMAGTHYRREIVLDVSMVLAFLPYMLWRTQGVWTDTIFSLLFSFIFFGLFSVIMRRGFHHFGRVVLSWLCAFGITLALTLCTTAAVNVFPSYGEIPVDRVSSVTVNVPYLEKVNIGTTKTALGSVTLKDSAEIRLALDYVKKKETSYSGFFFDWAHSSSPDSIVTVRFVDGTEKEFSFLTDRFLQAMLAEDSSFYERWASVTDEGTYAGAELVVVSPQEKTTDTVLLTKAQIESFIPELRRAKRALPLEDRVALRSSISKRSFDLFENSPDKVSYENLTALSEKTAYYVSVYTYSNGTYFCELLPVSADSAAFESIMSGNRVRAEKMIKRSVFNPVSMRVMDYPEDFLAQVPNPELRQMMIENLYEAYGNELLRESLNTYDTSSPEKRTTTVVLSSSSDSVVLHVDFSTLIRPFWSRLAAEFEQKVTEVLEESLTHVQLISQKSESTDPWERQQMVLSLYVPMLSQNGEDRMLCEDLLAFLRRRTPEIAREIQNGFADWQGKDLLFLSVTGSRTKWKIPFCSDDADLREVLKPYRFSGEIDTGYLVLQIENIRVTVGENTWEVPDFYRSMVFNYVQYEDYFDSEVPATIEIVWKDGSTETLQRKLSRDVLDSLSQGERSSDVYD